MNTVNHCAIAAANANNPTWQPAWIAECYARDMTAKAKAILALPSLHERRVELEKLTIARAQKIREQVEAEIKRLWGAR